MCACLSACVRACVRAHSLNEAALNGISRREGKERRFFKLYESALQEAGLKRGKKVT